MKFIVPKTYYCSENILRLSKNPEGIQIGPEICAEVNHNANPVVCIVVTKETQRDHTICTEGPEETLRDHKVCTEGTEETLSDPEVGT